MFKNTTEVEVNYVDKNAPGNGRASEPDDSNSFCPSLSWTGRLVAFFCITGVGMIITLASFTSVWRWEIISFVLLLVLGIVATIVGLMFLASPRVHMSCMSQRGRWIVALVYLISVFLSFLFGLLLRSSSLVVLFCVLQILSVVYYSITYIPTAWNGLVSCCTRNPA